MNELEEQSITEEHLAAFIDILGFRSLLDKAGHDEEKLREIHEIIEELNSWVEPRIGVDTKQDRVFSDCIYMSSVSLGENPFYSLYDHVGDIVHYISLMQAAMLIDKKIFVRGGIATGIKVFNNDDIEVSSAYYEAYKVESKLAKYPIIRISEDAVQMILNSDGKENHAPPFPSDSLLKNHISPNNNDSFYFVNYLRTAIEESYHYEPYEILIIHKENIIEEFEKASCPKIKNKYRWLSHNYHNKIVDEILKEGLIASDDVEDLRIDRNEISSKMEKE